ncbi:MAG: hypothetical protein U0T77_07490 [Chitinophagales bacterium]
MESVFISNILLVLVSFLVTYGIGFVIVSFIRTPNGRPFFREFLILTTGLFSVITFFSLFKTGGITINAGIALLTICMGCWLHIHNYLKDTRTSIASIRSEIKFPLLLAQIGIVIAGYLFLLLKMYRPATGDLYQVYGDFYNYAKNIQHLNKTGIESYYSDWYSGAASARTLYHYGELWYGAFISQTFKQPPFIAFYFHVFSFCMVLYIAGAAAILEYFFPHKKNYYYLLTVCILLLCGLSFYIPRSTLFTRGDWWDNGLLFQPKYLFGALVTFYGILLSPSKKIIPLIFISMLCVLCCVVIAPAVFICLAVYIFLLFAVKETSFRDFIFHGIWMSGALILIGLYALWIQHLNQQTGLTNETAYAVKDTLSLSYYFKTAFNCFAGQGIKSILSLFPYIALSLFVLFPNRERSRQHFRVILFLVVLHFSSILAYAIFFNRVDAVQLWTNIYVPLSAIVCFVLFVFSFTRGTSVIKLAAIMLVLLSIIQTGLFSRGTMIPQSSVHYLKNHYNGKAAVFFKSGDDFTSVFTKNINLYAPYPYLNIFYPDYNPVCLSIFDIPKSDQPILRATEEEIIQNSTFYKFIQLQKKHQQFISVEQSQLDFIRLHRIEFAFVYRHSKLPASLEPYVLQSWKDDMEGITSYRLKRI